MDITSRWLSYPPRRTVLSLRAPSTLVLRALRRWLARLTRLGFRWGVRARVMLSLTGLPRTRRAAVRGTSTLRRRARRQALISTLISREIVLIRTRMRLMRTLVRRFGRVPPRSTAIIHLLSAHLLLGALRPRRFPPSLLR